MNSTQYPEVKLKGRLVIYKPAYLVVYLAASDILCLKFKEVMQDINYKAQINKNTLTILNAFF